MVCLTACKVAIYLGSSERVSEYHASRPSLVVTVHLQSWAYVEYLDEVLGQLFDYLETSAFRNNTYVFLTSDNGPDELADITAEALKVRSYAATCLPGGLPLEPSRSHLTACCPFECHLSLGRLLCMCKRSQSCPHHLWVGSIGSVIGVEVSAQAPGSSRHSPVFPDMSDALCHFLAAAPA